MDDYKQENNTRSSVNMKKAGCQQMWHKFASGKKLHGGEIHIDAHTDQYVIQLKVMMSHSLHSM